MNLIKMLALFLFLFLNSFEVQAQSPNPTSNSFTLTGIINNLPSSGKIALGSVIEHPSLLQLDSQWVQISQGSFKISGTIADTVPVYIHYATDDGSGGLSTDIFFLEKGLLHVELDYLTMRMEIPNITGGKSNAFFKDLFGYTFKIKEDEIDSITDVMQNLYDVYKGDTLRRELSKKRAQMADANRMFREEIYKISKNNEASVLPLYVLYHIYNEKFEHMSEWLQTLGFNDYLGNSIIFKALSYKVNKRNLISTAAIFPDFIFQFLGDQKGTIKSSQLLTEKYTLIEFWFAKCGACIRQFDTFKDIYETSSIFKESLNMIMVTIDSKDYVNEAKQISKKYPENWVNLWDIDGKIADKLSINSYPFNVLLNKKGEVLKTNVEPYELLGIIKNNGINQKN